MRSPGQRLPGFEAAANASWSWSLQQAVASHHPVGAITPIRPAAADRFSPHVSAVRSAASVAGSQSTPLPVGLEFLPRRGAMFTPSPAAGFAAAAAAASAAASPMASSPDMALPATGGGNVGEARAARHGAARHGAASAAAAPRTVVASSNGEGGAADLGRRHHAAAGDSASPGTRGHSTTSNTPGGRPRINLSRSRRRQATSAAQARRPQPPLGPAEQHAAGSWPASPLSAMSTVLAALDCTGTRGSNRAASGSAAAARVSDQAEGGAAVDTSPPHRHSGSGRRLWLPSDDDDDNDDDDDDCSRGNERRFSGPSTWHDRRECGVAAKESSAAHLAMQRTEPQAQPQPKALSQVQASDDGLTRAWVEQGTTPTGAAYRFDGSKNDEDDDEEEDGAVAFGTESPAVSESVVPSAFADLFC